MMTGRITKDSAELRRVTIDFSKWLDTNETVSAVSSPGVVVQNATVWSQGGELVQAAPVQIVDATPLQVSSIAVMPGGTEVRLMLSAGTPGLVYAVTFLATGSASARVCQIDVLVGVRTEL